MNGITINIPAPPIRKGYRLNEASQLLGICRSSLYDLNKAGKIKFIKIAGRTIVPASEIDRIIEQGA
jgi:excisionase family DNA binding protein